MSILIKGMDMPKACFKCRLLDSYFWQCEITKKTASHSTGCVPSYCPLVPVPPHGRLIDADALIINLMDRGIESLQTEDFYEIQQAVADAPTIIEAEVDE